MCLHVSLFVCVGVKLCVCVYVCVCERTCVCVCVCVCLCRGIRNDTAGTAMTIPPFFVLPGFVFSGPTSFLSLVYSSVAEYGMSFNKSLI